MLVSNSNWSEFIVSAKNMEPSLSVPIEAAGQDQADGQKKLPARQIKLNVFTAWEICLTMGLFLKKLIPEQFCSAKAVNQLLWKWNIAIPQSEKVQNLNATQNASV